MTIMKRQASPKKVTTETIFISRNLVTEQHTILFKFNYLSNGATVLIYSSTVTWCFNLIKDSDGFKLLSFKIKLVAQISIG